MEDGLAENTPSSREKKVPFSVCSRNAKTAYLTVPERGLYPGLPAPAMQAGLLFLFSAFILLKQQIAIQLSIFQKQKNRISPAFCFWKYDEFRMTLLSIKLFLYCSSFLGTGFSSGF